MPDGLPPGTMVVEAWTSAISAGTEIANYLGLTSQHSTERRTGATILTIRATRSPASCRRSARASPVRAGRPRLRQGPHGSAAIVDATRFVLIPDGVGFDDAAMTTLTDRHERRPVRAHRAGRPRRGRRGGPGRPTRPPVGRLSGARPTVAERADRGPPRACASGAARPPAWTPRPTTPTSSLRG